jgi:vancomycin permeability regulator SanA
MFHILTFVPKTVQNVVAKDNKQKKAFGEENVMVCCYGNINGLLSMDPFRGAFSIFDIAERLVIHQKFHCVSDVGIVRETG